MVKHEYFWIIEETLFWLNQYLARIRSLQKNARKLKDEFEITFILFF